MILDFWRLVALCCCLCLGGWACRPALAPLPDPCLLDYPYQDGGPAAALARADALKWARQYRSAIRAFEAALATDALALPDRFYALNQVAYLHLVLHEPDRAREPLAAAQALALQSGADTLHPGAWGDFQLNRGWLAYRDYAPTAAKNALQQALEHYQTAYAPGAHLKIAQAHALLGMLHREFGKDPNPFFEHVEKAYEMVLAHAPLWPHSVEIELAMMHASAWKRQHQAMLAHAQNVVFLAQSQPDTLVVAWATAKSYEGRYLRYLARAEGKDIQPALDCLHESVRIGQKQPGLHMVTLLRSLANALSSPGRQPEFERTLAEIEQLEQRYGKNIAYPEPLRAGLARACKNPREAVRQLETFISKMANDSLVDEQVLDAALVSLSDHYKARRDYQRAYHCLGMVLTHDSPLYRKPISEEQLLNPNIYGPSPFPFFTLNKIGQVFLQQANGKRQSGYLKKALRAFYLSDSLMFAHNDAYNENIILNFQKEVGATLYGDMLEVLCRLDSLEPRNARYRNMALHFMDRMKSDVLFRYLPQNADSEQLRRTKARADSLLAQKNRLTPEGCRQLSMDLYRMEKVKFGNRLGQPVSQRSADAHAAIGPDQAVLHYGIYGAKVFGLCMNNGEVLLRRLPVHGDALAKAVDSIGQNLRTPNGDAAVLGDKAHTLYKLLIGPFEGVLQGRQDWLVVPDKCLFKLPFEVLKPEGADGAYLLERQGLALQYSTAWKIWAAGQASKAQDERSGDALFCNYGGRREGLVCSERERQALDKKADKLECLEGERCTKANFTRCWRSKPYGIVHLSLHGFADPVDAFNNKIWFGQGRRDSLLGFEIGALSGKVDLLVLSVCETYKGEAIASEGIYSIGRSFLQAGAKSLLSALWELDNCPNALLIEHFYAQMNQSPKAKALGQAKRLYLKDPNTPPRLKHPYYWAGLVMVS